MGRQHCSGRQEIGREPILPLWKAVRGWGIGLNARGIRSSGADLDEDSEGAGGVPGARVKARRVCVPHKAFALGWEGDRIVGHPQSPSLLSFRAILLPWARNTSVS